MSELGTGETVTTSEPGQAPVSGEAAPITTAAPTTPEPSTVQEITAVPSADNPNWDDDTRKYITELRQGDADKRVQLKRFKETFDGWPDEAVEGMLNLAKAIASEDSDTAVPVLQNLLGQLSPAQVEALQQQATAEETKYMTPEEVENFIKERETAKEAENEQQRQEKENLAVLEAEITELGYDITKPNPEASLLFHFASLQEGEGPRDFAAAHKAVEELFQQRIDDYVNDVVGRNGRFGKTRITGDTPAGPDGGAKKLGIFNGQSKKAMEEYLQTAE